MSLCRGGEQGRVNRLRRGEEDGQLSASVAVLLKSLSYFSVSVFSIDLCSLLIQPLLMYLMSARVCWFLPATHNSRCFVFVSVMCVLVSDNLH